MASVIKIGMGVLLAALAVNHASLAADAARAADSANSMPKDIVLLLDNSGSMKGNDPLALTKVALGQLLNEASSDTRIGIVLFDKNATLVSALTPVTDENRPFIASSLTRLNYNGSHTNIPAALAAGVAELGANGIESALKSLVLLTDGIIDTGDKKRDRQARLQARDVIVADAKERGIRIDTVALGNKTDAELLREFAARTGGHAYTAARAEDLPKVFQNLHQEILKLAALPAAKAGNASGTTVSPPGMAERGQALAETSVTPAPATAMDPAVDESDETTSKADGSDTGATGDNSLLYRMGMGVLFVGLSLLAAVLGWLGFRTIAQARDSSRLGAARGSMSATDRSMPAAYLEDFSGTTGRQYHEISKMVTIVGRAPGQQSGPISTIVIPHPAIGRRHAVIEYQHHGFWLIDQNSKNGTYLNGELLTQPVCLSHGDRLRFHDLEFGLTFAGMSLADDTLATGDLKLLRTARIANPVSAPAVELIEIAQDCADTVLLKMPPVRAEAGSESNVADSLKDGARDDDTQHPQNSTAKRRS